MCPVFYIQYIIRMTSDQGFKVPSWAGTAPAGLHLDVVKNGSLLQKLLLDEKNCYIFGRAKESCDFPLPHQSCSRQHAALVYHKHLKRPFLIDLGSTHGTFIGSMRLEANKPTQVPLDSILSFGASTRTYTLRERPPVVLPLITDNDGEEEGSEGGTLLGLPEQDNDLDDLTQFNTAHNRQISMVGIPDTEVSHKRKQHPLSISFADEEEIINPEDIDPSIGKFRNMVQTTIIPTKKMKMAGGEAQAVSPTSPGAKFSKFKQPLSSPTALYADTPSPSATTVSGYSGSTFFAKAISAAPPVANPTEAKERLEQLPRPSPALTWDSSQPSNTAMPSLFSSDEPRKKKYAKEAWPGKKPTHLLV